MPNIVKGSNAPSITIGGVTFTDLTNLICLWGGVTGAATGNSTLRVATATTGYQVPASKNFYCMAMSVDVRTAGFFYLCQSSNDVGMATNTAFTGAFSPANTATTSRTNAVVTGAGQMGQFQMDLTGFIIAQNCYIGASSDGSAFVGSFRIFGYTK